VLFASLVIAAAINAPPTSPEAVDHYSFWGPFQKISDENRWICSGLALWLIAICFSTRFQRSHSGWGRVALLLVGLHLLIFAKNFLAIGPSALFFLIGLVLSLESTQLVAWRMRLNANPALYNYWWPIVLASVGFLALNMIQYGINPAATMQVSDRFHGLTSNPQMYALTTAIMVPALLFQYTRDKRVIPRLIILSTFLVLVFFALRSGSRLSLLLSTVSILMYYRTRVRHLLTFAIPVAILALILLLNDKGLPLDSSSHLKSTDNTRSDVWSIQVQEILSHPLFGQPLMPGERLGFGENSYLASGATLGLAGLSLALGLAFTVILQVWALMNLEAKFGWSPQTALPIAILSTCLIGAFFEAFLLGIFTFPLMAMLYTSFIADTMIKPTSHRITRTRGRSLITMQKNVPARVGR
jgi:hypothetical protein